MTIDIPSMLMLGDTFFYWRDSGPNLWVGAITTFAIIGLGYLWCRTPKDRIVGIIICGAWAVYVPFVFIGAKIWPEEVSISAKEIKGRHSFSRFSVQVEDVQTIRAWRPAKGGYALHVFLKSKKKAVGIPVISDQHEEAYNNALRKVCHNADLEW